VRRPLLGPVLLTVILSMIGGPAPAQGPAPQADAPKGGAPAASGSGSSKEQSKSWADEVRSSIGQQPKGGSKQGGRGGAGQGGDADNQGLGVQGQPGSKR
jgi:hypothetical protein